MQDVLLILELVGVFPDPKDIEYDEASDQVTIHTTDIELLTSWHHKLIIAGYDPHPRKDSLSGKHYITFKTLLRGDK